MIYKFRPYGRTQWCPALNGAILDILREYDKPISVLEWEDAEEPLTVENYALAVRYGTPADDGIYLEMCYVAEANSVKQAAASYKTLAQIHKDYPHINTEEERRKIEAVSASIVEDARKRLGSLLDKPADPELEAHWMAVAGHR